MAADKFFEEIQPAAVLKHELLKRYLPVFVWKLGSTSRDGKVCYVDGYAGPGVYKDGSPGSPALAVNAARMIAESKSGDRLVGYFVEEKPANAQALRDYFASESIDWQVFEGDVHDRLPDVMQQVDGYRPLFAFLDPFGLGIPLDMLGQVVLNRKATAPNGTLIGAAATEVLLNFSFSGLRRAAGWVEGKGGKDGPTPRYLKTQATMVGKVDAAMGGTWWQPIWLSGDEDRERQILRGYLAELRKRGWQWWSIDVADSWQGPPAYNLILLTKHQEGVWHLNEALSNALEPYQQACLAASGELDLDPLTSHWPEWIDTIAANIETLLAQGQDVQIIYRVKDVLGDTLGLARERHIRAAVQRLYDEKKTPTNPKGVKKFAYLTVKPWPS